MLLSQFELLLNKRQFPKAEDLELPDITPIQRATLDTLSREVIQGYFLTISNLSKLEIVLMFTFTVAIEPPTIFDENTVTVVFDIDGKNIPINLASKTFGTRNYSITVPPKDTGLLIVQPNPLKITEEEIEIRGYVNVSIFENDGRKIDLLFTPEHRATFYKRNDSGIEKLDQIAYALPTTTGGSLFTLD
ncbi:MAG: hypothetical protein AAF298_09460 [Cyanobacteria bacterium P01_A01_bin.40]